jgi:hypothetical protein
MSDLDTLCRRLRDVESENARLRIALARLGSAEVLTQPFAMDRTTPEGAELLARITFARNSLKVQ